VVFGVDVVMRGGRVVWLLAKWTPDALYAPSRSTEIFFVHVIISTVLFGVALLNALYRYAHVLEQQKVAELEAALAQVRTLEGMLPICAWCKRIRDENDEWQKLERYLASHTKASFTHGMCPECAKKFG
jgi:hypothetical protein